MTALMTMDGAGGAETPVHVGNVCSDPSGDPVLYTPVWATSRPEFTAALNAS